MSSDIRILLHNIRSTHNIGSIFRTSDAIGVSRIYFSGYSPCPIDRFGRPVRDIAKTALGSELTIPWEKQTNPSMLIKKMKKEGFKVVGLEQDIKATDYKMYIPYDKVLVLVGNEVRGLSKNLRDKCDALIEIPMIGKKESLNVSVAFGVAMFRIFDR